MYGMAQVFPHQPAPMLYGNYGPLYGHTILRTTLDRILQRISPRNTRILFIGHSPEGYGHNQGGYGAGYGGGGREGQTCYSCGDTYRTAYLLERC